MPPALLCSVPPVMVELPVMATLLPAASITPPVFARLVPVMVSVPPAARRVPLLVIPVALTSMSRPAEPLASISPWLFNPILLTPNCPAPRMV